MDDHNYVYSILLFDGDNKVFTYVAIVTHCIHITMYTNIYTYFNYHLPAWNKYLES